MLIEREAEHREHRSYLGHLRAAQLRIPTDTPHDIAARLRERLDVLDRAVALASPADPRRKHALLFAKSLIERIEIAPLPARGEVEISVQPRADALVAFALDEKWALAPESPADTDHQGSDNSSGPDRAARP